MPVEIRDLDDGLGNIIIGQGTIKEEEYIDVLKEHLTKNEDKFNKYRYSLNDYTATTEVDLTVESVDLIADYCEKAAIVNPDHVVAIVASQDVIFGLARVWEMLSAKTKWDTKVFRNREDAEAWIKKMVEERFGIDNLTFD